LHAGAPHTIAATTFPPLVSPVRRGRLIAAAPQNIAGLSRSGALRAERAICVPCLAPLPTRPAALVE
jgi:hypothetical protein